MRCLLLVMCTYPFAKKALTLHLARGEGRGTVAESAAPPSGETEALPEAAPIVLPPLSTSDDFVRAIVEKLSAHPVLASFVVTEQLVRKAVVVVANVAEGLSPARLFPHLRPEEQDGVEVGFRGRTNG